MPRPSSSWLSLPLVLLTGCGDACLDYDPGTAVGNPGDAALTIGEADGMTFARASVSRGGLELVGCDDGRRASVAFDAELNLLESPVIELPAGQWCEAIIDVSFVVEGVADAGGEFSFELTTPAFSLYAPQGHAIAVDGNAWTIELGGPGWLTPETAAVYPDNVHTVGLGDPFHENLALRVIRESAIYPDLDADHTVDDSERGSVAAGADETTLPRWVGVGTMGRRLISFDGGFTWHEVATSGDEAKSLRGAAYGNGVFVGVGGGTGGLSMVSPDGLSWTEHSPINADYVTCLHFGDGKFVAAGSGGGVIWSVDGINWTREATLPFYPSSLTYGNGVWVIVGKGGYAASTDLVNWTVTEEPTTAGMDIVFAEGTFVMAGGHLGITRRSTDGFTWGTERQVGEKIQSITYGEPWLVMVGEGKLWVSENMGVGWRLVGWNGIGTVTYQDGVFLGVQWPDDRRFAIDPEVWHPVPSDAVGDDWVGVYAYGGGEL